MGAEPKWLEIARAEIGTAELPGHAKNNPRILEYINTMSYMMNISHGKGGPKYG